MSLRIVVGGLVALIVVGVSACSGGTGAVGEACSDNGQCSSLSAGYCAQAGICVRPCSVHADCGCATNTTTGDMADGKCGAACVNFGGTVGAVCTKVCANNGACAGSSSCNQVIDNGVSAGYSVCD